MQSNAPTDIAPFMRNAGIVGAFVSTAFRSERFERPAMTAAAALVKRLTETVTEAADAFTRGAGRMLDRILPQPQPVLVPVRVRPSRPASRSR